MASRSVSCSPHVSSTFSARAPIGAFAQRVSRFEKRALEVGKKLVNARAGVPSEGDLWVSNHVLAGVDAWPEAQAMMPKLNAAGFSKDKDFELNMAERLGNLPSE